MITRGEITSAARPPRDTWIATATGSIPAPLSFFPRLIHTCFSLWENPLIFLCVFVDTCALSFINVGLNITAMTGKLAEKLPLTMSSLINTIPDSLYPEEDIPTSMNIFTNTESINHYSQMNTGKIFSYFSVCVLIKVVQTAMCANGNSCLGARSTCLRSGCCAQRQILVPDTFSGSGVTLATVNQTHLFNDWLSLRLCDYFSHSSSLPCPSPKCQDFRRNVKKRQLDSYQNFLIF